MKRHRFDTLSFLAGLVVAIIGLAVLLPPSLVELGRFVANMGGWLWPLLLIVAGAAVLIPAVLPKKPEPGQD